MFKTTYFTCYNLLIVPILIRMCIRKNFMPVFFTKKHLTNANATNKLPFLSGQLNINACRKYYRAVYLKNHFFTDTCSIIALKK